MEIASAGGHKQLGMDTNHIIPPMTSYTEQQLKSVTVEIGLIPWTV